MQPTDKPIGIFKDVGTFISRNKLLCGTTFGLAILVYAIKTLAGRAVAWIRHAIGTAHKTEVVAKNVFGKTAQPGEDDALSTTSSVSSASSLGEQEPGDSPNPRTGNFPPNVQRIPTVIDREKMLGVLNNKQIVLDKRLRRLFENILGVRSQYEDFRQFTHNLVTTSLETIDKRAEFYHEYAFDIPNVEELLLAVNLEENVAKKEELKQKLTEFIVKGLANEWGMEGVVDIGGNAVGLLGQQQDISHMQLANSVEKYFTHDVRTQHLSSLGVSTENQAKLRLAMYKSPLYLEGRLPAREALQDLENGIPLTLGAGWAGHAVEVTICDGYLIYTNRSPKDRLDTSSEYMKRFKITKPITEGFIDKLRDQQSRYDEDMMVERRQWLEGLGSDTMASELGLVLEDVIEKQGQKSGNCNWANGKGGVYGAMLLLIRKEIKANNPNVSEVIAFEQAKNIARPIYKDWEVTSRADTLSTFLDLEQEVLNNRLSLSPKDYYLIISNACGKIALKKSYRLGSAVDSAAQMMMDAKSKLQKSKLPLIDCFQDTASAEDANTVISSPLNVGGFVLRRDRQMNMYFIHYKDTQGRVVQEQLTYQPEGIFLIGNHRVTTLGGLMSRMDNLTVPISCEYIKETLNAPVIKSILESKVVASSWQEAEEFLEKRTIEFTVVARKNGAFTFCFKVPQFVRTATNGEMLKYTTEPDESLRMFFSRAKKGEPQFQRLKQIGLGFEDFASASRAFEDDPNKMIVVYKSKDNQGKVEYLAAYRNSNTDYPIYPEQGFFSQLRNAESYFATV